MSIWYYLPTLKEITDIYNVCIGNYKDYQLLPTETSFSSVDDLLKEYYSIKDANIELRQNYETENNRLFEELKSIPFSSQTERHAEIFRRCKEKYNPIYKAHAERMKLFAIQYCKFVAVDKNREALKDDNSYYNIKDVWAIWIDSSFFYKFSPFVKKRKVTRQVDFGPSDEQIIMNALRKGHGDLYGY